MLAPEDHRLQVEAPARREHACDVFEEAAVDRLLTPGAEVLPRTEVLESAEAGDGIERPEGLEGHLARVMEVSVQVLPPAGLELRRGKCDAHPRPAHVSDIGQERPPSAAEVEDAAAGLDPDPFSDEFVLSPLRLLEAERESRRRIWRR